jgi:hypothetical protein
MNSPVTAILERWRWRLVLLALVCVVTVGFRALELTNNKGYQPTQPIAFSHAVHAGQLGMDCLYCHGNAEVSKHATVPSVDSCMGCHSIVRTDRPEIVKLRQYYENGQPVPWVRIHSLPDHAYFNHAQHVGAGVACQTCHGEIQTMEVVKQWVDTSMGWCMTCHRNDDYLKTPERVAHQTETMLNAHSYFWQPGGVLPTPDEQSLAARFRAEGQEFWNAEDLNRLYAEKSSEDRMTAAKEVGRIVEEAMGYNNLARQTGPGVIDHVKMFQNASLNCNTCHN